MTTSTNPSSDTRKTAPLIQWLRVHKSYGNGRPVFQDVNLEINKGDFVFLMGPSGAGKSTFFKLLLAMELPSRGHVLFNGRSLQRMSSYDIPYFRRRMGIIFQDPKVIMDRTVLENVTLPLEIAGKDPKFARSKAVQVLTVLGLDPGLDSKCSRLSVSEQQLVAIARAVVNDPVLLLWDEPAGKLDEETHLQVMGLLGNIHVRGTTVIIASHQPSLVDTVPHGRVLAIHDGGILERVILPDKTVWRQPSP
jgi:cell division transport system ATP-binding protein